MSASAISVGIFPQQDRAGAEAFDDEAELLERRRMFDQQRGGVGIEIDDDGAQQYLALDAVLGALALQAFIDDALMGGVLIDDDDAVARLRDDISVVHLRARRAERRLEIGRRRRRDIRRRVGGGRKIGEALLRGLGEAGWRSRRGAPIPGLRESRGAAGANAGARKAAIAPLPPVVAAWCSAPCSACLIAPTIRPRTSPPSRKRTSALAGWTLTSTSRGSHSRNSATTACRSRGR